MKSGNVTFHKYVCRITTLGLLSLLFYTSMAGDVLADSHNQRSASQVESGANESFTDADRNLWLADFQQLINEMSSHYANLEWAVSSRHMNLAESRSQTEARIRTAPSEDDERKIFSKFLDSFGDGHLEISWPTIKSDAGQPSNQEPEATSICSRLGYAHHGSEGVNFSLLEHYESLGGVESADFPGGILKLQNGVSIGTIRIAVLSEHNYPDACAEARAKLELTDSSVCDDNCSDKVEIEAANLLLGKLARRAAQLRAAGASYILVDVSQNGGGSNWVDAVARTLAPVPLQDSRMAYMRHPHWTKQLQDALDDIESDIRAGKDPRALLEQSASAVQTAITNSKESCDQSSFWTNSRVSCSLMIPGFRFPFEIVPYAQPGSFSGLKSRTRLFSSLAYSYQESSNRLPLVVVVDKNTWSAAEYLPAVIQDNKAGMVLGELTGGAGCGYTNGGIPAILKNSRATVKMPDCVRLRADMSNEEVGVTPDILIPWASRDTPYQRVHKLELGLESATRGRRVEDAPALVR